MKITIDRFEGDFAVVELPDGKFCNMPLCLVPKGASEGSVIEITCDDDKSKAENIRRRMDKLFEK